MQHQPRYDWSKLWAGMEQVHNILDLLLGLYLVGSTDPVADATALHDDKVLREAVAKFLLDHVIYPIAISVDKQFWLMRVRRPFDRSELETWLSRRAFRFASPDEVHAFLESTGFEENVYNFGELDQNGRTCKVWSIRDGVPESGGTNLEAKIDHHEFCGHFDTFLAVLVPEELGDFDPYPTDLEYTLEPAIADGQIYCGRCGRDPSGWTGECPDHGSESLRVKR